MDEQRQVAEFITEHDMQTTPAFRLLDLLSELGEVAKDVNESSGYGSNPDAVAVNRDEIGDALFALLALAESLDVAADDALAESLAKYEDRIERGGDASSGE